MTTATTSPSPAEQDIRAPVCCERPTAGELARAFGVVFVPSIVLDAAAGAAVAATARSLARRQPPAAWAAGGTAALAGYLVAVRPWMLRWGATRDETRQALPGDEMVPEAARQSTRAVTIEAAPEAVWPWLAQIGQDRGGFYSYEWLENLAGCRMLNAEWINPEWQHREIGETVYLHPLHGLPVARFEPDRVLSLEGWGSWVLAPLAGGRTRLIARSRTARGAAALLDPLLMEIPHFLMERKMLLGIKRRAEARR